MLGANQVGSEVGVILGLALGGVGVLALAACVSIVMVRRCCQGNRARVATEDSPEAVVTPTPEVIERERRPNLLLHAARASIVAATIRAPGSMPKQFDEQIAVEV